MSATDLGALRARLRAVQLLPRCTCPPDSPYTAWNFHDDGCPRLIFPSSGRDRPAVMPDGSPLYALLDALFGWLP